MYNSSGIEKAHNNIYITLIKLVQFLFFLNQKFPASSHLLCLSILISVRPGRKPLRPFFSRRSSFYSFVSDYSETVCLEYINADVVNTCGNLLSRCTAPKLNPEQLFPRKCRVTYQKKFNATERQTFEDLPMLVCKY